MEINKTEMVAADTARTVAAACVSASAPVAVNQFAVRVTPPITVKGPRESSALRTDGTTSRSGHLLWSPPV